MNDLLLRKLNDKRDKESKTLQKSLIKHRNKILTFLYHQEVPSHNNGSELAIRNAKVKMKISGCFRSAQKYYAVIRSIVDTFVKNKLPIFENLLKLERGEHIQLNLA